MRLVRPSAPLVVASIALLVAAATPGYAALSVLAKDSVGSPQIRSGGVHAPDLASKSVTSVKIKDGGVKRQDLAADSVGSAQIGTAQVLGSDLAAGSVDYSKIADGTVGRAELANSSVDGSKIVDGSVTPADLAAGVRPARAAGWSRYPTLATWSTIGGTLTSIGSLSTDGGGALALGQPSTLVVTGQVRVRNSSGTAGAVANLDCSVYLNGAGVGPTANVGGLAVGESVTVPISGLTSAPAGSADIGVSCTGGNAQIQFVRVGVLAFPS